MLLGRRVVSQGTLNAILAAAVTLRSDLWKIIALRMSWSIILMQSVLVPYFFYKGLTPSDVFVVQTVFATTLLVGELPAGILADAIGRRRVIVFACLLRGLGGTGLVVLSGVLGMAMSYVALAFANSLLSGVDIAVVVEQAAKDPKQRRAASVYIGRQKMLTQVTSAISAIAGSAVGSVSLGLLGILNMGFAWLALPIGMALSDDRRQEAGARRTSQAAITISSEVVRFLRSSPKAVFLSLNIALLSALSLTSAYALQVVWVSNGLGTTMLGVLFALRTGAAGLWAGVGHRLSAAFSARALAFWTCACAALGMVAAIGPTPWHAVLSVLLIAPIDGAASVSLIAKLNETVDDSLRATLNSVYTLVARMLVALAAPILALVVGPYGATAPPLILSAVALGGALLAFLSLDASVDFSEAEES